MKQIFVVVMWMFAVCSANAQGQWEKPVSQGQQVETEKRGLFDKNKAPIDPKYLEGNVPEVDGKVCWVKTYSLPGKTVDEIYNEMLDLMQKFITGPEHTKKSNVAVVNKEQHQIGVRLQENLVFANKFLSLDQTLMNYTLFISCKNEQCEIRLTNISYNYEMDRPTSVVYTAEEMIADGVALNKKKTGFTKGGSKKFRMKTIDRKDAIFKYIEENI